MLYQPCVRGASSVGRALECISKGCGFELFKRLTLYLEPKKLKSLVI